MITRRGVAAASVALSALAGCSGPDPAPFQQPVPGAQSVTDWIAEVPPDLAAFRVDDGPPAEILEMLRANEGVIHVAPNTAQLDDERDGQINGYIRSIPAMSEHPFRGVDVRFTLRRVGDGWEVSVFERRWHCATAEPSTDFCQ